MSSKSRRIVRLAGLLSAALAMAPAVAQHGGGGGGGGHSGGGGGGGHSGGGGGGHVGGGGGGHSFGGHFSGGHVAAAHYGGSAPSGHFAAAGHAYAATAGARSYAQGFHGSSYGGRNAYGYPGGGVYQHGYSTGAHWGGGYWRGGYWPRAYYGFGFSWFLPVLPLAYATYWWGGVPYYYASDVYYTWNPDYDGYVATDPPPVNDSPAAEGSAAPPQDYQGAAPAQAPVGGQIFMYPKNGQSEQQQSIDKRECQQWAASQAGTGGGSGNDYRRAMMACIEGRGYSAN